LSDGQTEPRFGAYHTASNPVNWFDPDGTGPAPAVSDARPAPWDGFVYPYHDEPLDGWKMPVCEDQSWDASTHLGYQAGTRHLLKVSSLTSGTTPYRSTALFTTQLLPGGCSAYDSMALAGCMPDETGAAASNAGLTSLFEAYTSAFCELGQP
jgi:hypothetical protein